MAAVWLLTAEMVLGAAGGTVAVFPAEFELAGPGARQTLLVQRSAEGKVFEQLGEGVKFQSSDPAVLEVQDGVAYARADGEAAITVDTAAGSARANVRVRGTGATVQRGFRNQVQPVLAKTGCNAGACHGAAAGQNGFRLSLRGYDDEGDFLTLTRQAFGRRVNPSDPGRSFLLLKATGTVPHKGGQRFETGSLEYEILADWIASGAPGPSAEDPRIVRIEMLPPQVILKRDSTQQLIVRAYFSDGRSEDVTRWAKYTAANASVTQVGDQGEVKVVGYGEGAVTAWYLSRIATATVTVPFENAVEPDVFAKAPRRNFIDELVLAKLESLRLPPSGRAGDSEFLRRAYLDTIGSLPTLEETRSFLAESGVDKRDALIERLLAHPRFVDYWTYRWAELLLVSSKSLNAPAMWAYYNWIRDQVAANTPWDRLVQRIVTAQGSTLENGAANFYVLHDNPADLSETTSQAFLGMSINCAKCHNHPMEKWTNDQYYQMANLFARVRTKTGTADGEKVVFAAAAGDLVQPLRGRPQTPAPLDGETIALEDPADRREHLAKWLTAPANPYFTRAIVNRTWDNFFGVALVENVDDLRVTNPASNEALLSAAAKFLAEQRYDLKALMRAILQSETYQRTSRPRPENEDEDRFYARYYPKRLMAEVLLDACSDVTGSPTEFKGYPAGWRALQLPDSRIESYFLASFGRAEREKTCSCERSSEPSVSQVLHLFNGDTVNKKLEAKGNRLERQLASKRPPEALVEEVFLTALARKPTDAEREKFTTMLAGAEEADRRAALEDVYWAVLSSKEFLFNH